MCTTFLVPTILEMYLTYEQTLADAKRFYPEFFWQFRKEIDSLIDVEKKLTSLARCDDLTADEKYKVEVLLPNVRELLT